MKKKKVEKERVDWKIVVIGIICLSAIEICALLNGVNGTLMSLVIAVIGLAIGVTIPNPIRR